MITILKNQKVLLSILVGFLVFTPGLVFAGFLETTLWTAVVGIFGRILALCAILMNYGINEFVIGFADNYTTSGVGKAIDETWVLIRDIMNLAFIFGLIYIGFKIILDSDDSRTRSMLANLIIAALLVNFSLFITKFTVDLANSFAAEIAVNGFAGKDEPIPYAGGAAPDGAPTMRYKVDMAGDLMNRMGINSVYTPGETPSEWGYIFGTALLFIITSFVFAAGGILLAVRFVALNLYMVMSPFMFIGWALPPLARYTTEYWRGFLKRAFFAPIYFLFMYFSLHILNGLNESRNLASSNASFRNTFGGSGIDVPESANSTIPFFVVACIFMLASIVIANKMGADGASQAIKIGQDLRRKAQNAAKRGTGAVTFGVGARVGQKTVGAGANRLASSSRFQKFAGDTKLGEYMYRGTKKVADSSFDGRNVGGLGKSMGLGAGMKGGYDSRKKEAEKRGTEFHDMLEADMSTTQNQKRVQTIQDELVRERMMIEGKDEFSLQTDDVLDTDIKALDEEIELLTETLQNQVAAGQLTTNQQKEQQDVIDNKTTERDKRDAVLDDRTVIKALRDQGLEAASEAMIAESNGNERLATEYRQKAENFQKELDKKKDYASREAALKTKLDKDGNSKGYAEDVVKGGAQAAYVRGLANESDGFNFLFNKFSADKLAAIKNKNLDKEDKNVVKSDNQILKELKRTMGPNTNSKIYGDNLKEAFKEALEDNRLKTAKALVKKSRSNSAKKANLASLKEVFEDSGVGTKKEEPPESDGK